MHRQAGIVNEDSTAATVSLRTVSVSTKCDPPCFSEPIGKPIRRAKTIPDLDLRDDAPRVTSRRAETCSPMRELAITASWFMVVVFAALWLEGVEWWR